MTLSGWKKHGPALGWGAYEAVTVQASSFQTLARAVTEPGARRSYLPFGEAADDWIETFFSLQT
jgi:hypothetical protein